MDMEATSVLTDRPVDEELVCIYIHIEYYSVIKKFFFTSLTTWKELSIILSKTSQTKKDKYCIYCLYVESNNTNE